MGGGRGLGDNLAFYDLAEIVFGVENVVQAGGTREVLYGVLKRHFVHDHQRHDSAGMSAFGHRSGCGRGGFGRRGGGGRHGVCSCFAGRGGGGGGGGLLSPPPGPPRGGQGRGGGGAGGCSLPASSPP